MYIAYINTIIIFLNFLVIELDISKLQNLTKDYMRSCTNGKPTVSKPLLSENCFGDYVIMHDPPLIYNINHDPGEQFPLNGSKYLDILTDVNDLVQAHISSIEPVDPQISNYNDDLQPCCNPPTCVCNYPDSALSLKVSFSGVLWTLLCSFFMYS